MELYQIKYFLAVCQWQNFTRAASHCHVAQPSLTKAIHKLEQEFGGALFQRGRSQSILTELGRRVRPHFEAMWHAREAAQLDARSYLDAEKATVRLGVMSTISPTRMTDFFARLRTEAPTLELVINEVPGKDLIEAMQNDVYDAALLAWPSPPPSIHMLPLYSERFVVAFSPGHPFGEKNAVDVSMLEGIDYLSRVHCEFPEYYEALGFTRPIGTRVRYSSEREDWIQAMVAAGHGCSVMPEFLPVFEGITVRPLINPEVTRIVSLATVAGRRHSSALTAMVRCAERHPWPGADFRNKKANTEMLDAPA